MDDLCRIVEFEFHVVHELEDSGTDLHFKVIAAILNHCTA